MDTSFAGAFWGISLFGDQPQRNQAQIGGETLDLKQTHLSDWLLWLRANKNRPGIFYSANQEQLWEQFVVGNAAFLVADSDTLALLRSEMVQEGDTGSGVRVLPLPEGPGGPATPFLTVDGFLFSTAADDRQIQLAVKLAQFATASQSQLRLIQEANQIPSNLLALQKANDSAINSFVQQATFSVLLPPRPQGILLAEGGDRLYQEVLHEGALAEQTTAAFLRNEN